MVLTMNDSRRIIEKIENLDLSCHRENWKINIQDDQGILSKWWFTVIYVLLITFFNATKSDRIFWNQVAETNGSKKKTILFKYLSDNIIMNLSSTNEVNRVNFDLLRIIIHQSTDDHFIYHFTNVMCDPWSNFCPFDNWIVAYFRFSSWWKIDFWIDREFRRKYILTQFMINSDSCFQQHSFQKKFWKTNIKSIFL